MTAVKEKSAWRRLIQNRPTAWLVGTVAALAACYLPGSFLLLTVAMWGGFSDVSRLKKELVLVIALAAIAGAVYLLARTIKRALMGE